MIQIISLGRRPGVGRLSEEISNGGGCSRVMRIEYFMIKPSPVQLCSRTYYQFEKHLHQHERYLILLAPWIEHITKEEKSPAPMIWL
jgi:hypothetical protein